MPSVFSSIDDAEESDGEREKGHADSGWPGRQPPHTPGGDWVESLYGSPEEDASTSVEMKLERRSEQGGVRYWHIADRYLVTPLRSGLLIIDPHLAHQRIVYEHALTSLRSGRGLTQQLLFPETLEVPVGDHNLLLELMPKLRAVGFEIEEFGGRSFIVRGIPSDVGHATSQHLLREMLEEYREGVSRESASRDEAIARSLARRGAIRPGVRLSQSEINALVDQLFLCSSPYTCPAGRPTMVRLTAEELARRFGR